MTRSFKPLLIPAAWLLFASGSMAAPKPAKKPLAPPKKSVKVTGYINVTSHCQEPLLKVLHDLDKKYGDKMTLEIIDFGSPAGRKRWLADGHRCLTILIDGKNNAMVERDGKVGQVYFQMPPGFQWEMADLKQAIAERVAALPAKRLSRPVTARQNGSYGEVIAGRKVILRYRAGSGGKNAVERARITATRLQRLYLDSLTPSEVQSGKQEGIWVVTARGKVLATVTAADARLAKTTPKKLAAVWTKNLKSALK